jgi:hypothetical protein
MVMKIDFKKCDNFRCGHLSHKGEMCFVAYMISNAIYGDMDLNKLEVKIKIHECLNEVPDNCPYFMEHLIDE